MNDRAKLVKDIVCLALVAAIFALVGRIEEDDQRIREAERAANAAAVEAYAVQLDAGADRAAAMEAYGLTLKGAMGE